MGKSVSVSESFQKPFDPDICITNKTNLGQKRLNFSGIYSCSILFSLSAYNMWYFW